MSKWLRKDDYEMFADQKAKDKEKENTDTVGGFYKKWKNPQMGTQEKAKEYKARLLPDPVKGYYKNYLYHGFKSGEKFQYILCEKTYDMDAYCPWCEVTKILYQGNDSDKRKAKEYKRKERFVSNVFIVEDPRDADTRDEEYKVAGTVRLYEFPATVESKISNEITDKEQGYGIAIFDPESGYDFILKIKAKPKDDKGKEWPDYGDTMFARNGSAITPPEGKTIEDVMGERTNLEEYIKSLRKSPEDTEKLLKAEMLWDDVGHSFEKHMKVADSAPSAAPVREAAPETPQNAAPAPESAPVQQEAPAQQEAAPAPTPAGDDDTDALLAELQDM
jgi:hypothetical protein